MEEPGAGQKSNVSKQDHSPLRPRLVKIEYGDEEGQDTEKDMLFIDQNSIVESGQAEANQDDEFATRDCDS